MAKTINFLLAGTICLFAVLPVQAENRHSDPVTQKILDEYDQANRNAEWVNPWYPEATGVKTKTFVSGDEQLTRIVARYTREMLDRGGWSNALLQNSDYSVGNLLLAANIGEGVTYTVDD